MLTPSGGETRKMKIMNIGKTKGVHHFREIKINGEIVEIAGCFNYLGFIIEDTLKVSQQQAQCMKNSSNKLFLLSKLRNSLDNNYCPLYKILYNCINVRCYIEYTNCFLLTCTKFERTKKQKLQNRGLKIALNKNCLFNMKRLHKETGLTDWEIKACLGVSRLMFIVCMVHLSVTSLHTCDLLGEIIYKPLEPVRIWVSQVCNVDFLIIILWIYW